ncbi:MAG: NIPSNAP family protein [Planctomycetes bacterium]|nr:NIPSNAP family protein [Planctomycetota bacterium]
MTTRAFLAAIAFFGLSCVLVAQEKDTRVFEMRTYFAPPGRLDDLQARFRDYTLRLFEKHGMTNIGYWTPIDNPDNKLVYVLGYPSAEAKAAAWKAFFADPDWKEVRTKTEANGKLVTKVESVMLVATDYSPEIKPAVVGDRVFELRTYTASPGNLKHLNARFREHTVKLFEKHGMTNIAYWNVAEGQPDADVMLIYVLAHKSVEAANASFAAFRQDPAWTTARAASEEKAGGSLTAKDGVKSEFLKATDYSPMR